MGKGRLKDQANFDLSRRQFLFAGSLLLSGCATWRGSVGTSVRAGLRHYAIGGVEKDIVIVDLRDFSTKSLPSSVLGHSYIAHPHRSNLVMTVEKFGEHAALVDVAKAQIVQEFQAPAGFVFYGHTAFSADGRIFWSTQVSQKTGLGFIREYRFSDLSVSNEAQVAPGGMHDLCLLSDHQTLVATSSGVRSSYIPGDAKPPTGGVRIEKSALLFFDCNDFKILDKQELADESLIFGHLERDVKDRLYCLTTPFAEYSGPHKAVHGTAWRTSRGQKLKPLVIPDPVSAQLKNELLSLRINEKDRRLVVTNPLGKRLLEFDVDSLDFLRSSESASMGVALNPQNPSEILIAPRVPLTSAHWSVVSI